MAPPRRGRGRPRKSVPLSMAARRTRVLRGLYPRRPIATMTHVIKRLGQTVLVDNGGVTGFPRLQSSGGNSFTMGLPLAGALPFTTDVGLASKYELSSAVDYTDLTQLFDRYKIVGIKLKVLYQSNIGDVGRTALPVLYYAWDGDDNQSPSSAESVTTKAYCKTRILNGNREFSIYFKPRVAKELNQGPFAATGQSSEKAPWVDSNSPSVPHFGMKFWLANFVNGAVDAPTALLRIQPTYYLALRDTQ